MESEDHTGDLNDVDARELAFSYIAKRTKLTTKLRATETEFERLAVVAMDPGAAMGLNEERLALEQEVEDMIYREEELAELLIQIRGVKDVIKSKGNSLKELEDDLAKARVEDMIYREEELAELLIQI